MPINIKTDKETEYKQLTMQELSNLISIVFRSTYTSHFHISYWDHTKDSRFVGYGGSICCTDTEEDFFDDGLPYNVDVYICPNGMKTKHKRTTENLICIQNLVIDIDCHDDIENYEEYSKHINQIQTKILNEAIIKPNLINQTGRGLHLWYWIEPCHVSLNKLCMSVIDMICANIQSILDKTSTKLTIDKASSMKLGGLFRLPYSYNTKAKTWSKAQLIHEDLPNINQLKTELQEHGYKSTYFLDQIKKPKKQKKFFKWSDKTWKNDYAPYMIKRKKFMDHIFETRTETKGCRDLMIFGMFSTLIHLVDEQEAVEYCEQLNLEFEQPLKYGEMAAIFGEVKKKKHKFTVEKFLDFVQATDEERAWYKKLSKKEKKKQQTKQHRQERDAKVMELYNQGVSIVDIGKMVGVSRPTIYKIIREA